MVLVSGMLIIFFKRMRTESERVKKIGDWFGMRNAPYVIIFLPYSWLGGSHRRIKFDALFILSWNNLAYLDILSISCSYFFFSCLTYFIRSIWFSSRFLFHKKENTITANPWISVKTTWLYGENNWCWGDNVISQISCSFSYNIKNIQIFIIQSVEKLNNCMFDSPRNTLRVFRINHCQWFLSREKIHYTILRVLPLDNPDIIEFAKLSNITSL